MYNALLAVHVIAVVGLFLAIGYATMALGRARRAATATEVARAARMGSLAVYVNVALMVVVVLAAGYLVGKKWSWSLGWVSAALVGVIVTVLLALVVLAPRLSELGRGAQTEGVAPPSRALQLQANDPLAWGAAQLIALLYVGIVVLMFAKPSGAVSAIILIVAALLGAGATMPARARHRRLQTGS
jgi:uncharacterized membrane protein